MMVEKGKVEKIYEEYRKQIDAVLEATGKNYKKSAEIISWFYGGSIERWRKILKNKKGNAIPSAVKEFLHLQNDRK